MGRKAVSWLAAIAALALIALAIIVKTRGVLEIDVLITRFVQQLGGTATESDWLYSAVKFISFFGVTSVAAIMVLITALVFLATGYKREAIFFILLPISSGINWLLKILINRSRPSSDLVLILEKQHDASFPSGHTVFYTVFFGFLIFIMLRQKKIPVLLRGFLTIFSIVMILTVGFARVYLGVHWVSDVAAGYLLGIFCLAIILSLYAKK